VNAETSDRESLRGLLAGLAAFVIWGGLPLYLRPLLGVSSLQVVAHRVVWACLLVLGLLAWRGELPAVRAALLDRGTRLRLLATAVLVSINWLVYVWSVTHGHVIESSLGYFINPLVNVLLGVTVLRERLNRVQGLAVLLAAAGVAYLTWQAGRPPWIALVLAISFGSYGLLRKLVAAEALVGLAAETLLLAPIGAGYLIVCELSGNGAFVHAGAGVSLLLLLGGAITALPLGLFAFATRRIRYATVGVLQYVGPSLQLVLGIVVYGEAFPLARALGFSLIWLALVVYALDGLVRARAAA
jgi:chloramphenicol-sensitive protein RarD